MPGIALTELLPRPTTDPQQVHVGSRYRGLGPPPFEREQSNLAEQVAASQPVIDFRQADFAGYDHVEQVGVLALPEDRFSGPDMLGVHERLQPVWRKIG